jgi:hypothetical protein
MVACIARFNSMCRGSFNVVVIIISTHPYILHVVPPLQFPEDFDYNLIRMY